MTDRYNSFLVILDRDIRDDDAQAILTTLKQVRGVVDVKPNISNNFEGVVGQARLANRFKTMIMDFYDSIDEGIRKK